MIADTKAGARASRHTVIKEVPASAFGRRTFLHALGAGVMSGVAAPFASASEVAGEIGSEMQKARYRQSEHVNIYYRVCGYPI